MKNIKFVCLLAGLTAVVATQSVLAEEKKPAERPTREELREQLKSLSPEQREAKIKEFRDNNPEIRANMEKRRGDAIKELGLDPEELRKFPEPERRQKMKETADKKLAELQKKKSDGKISDEEKKTLERLESRKKFIEQGGIGNRRPGKPAGKPEAK